MTLLIRLVTLQIRSRLPRRLRGDETGFSTAELLGNAALGIVALVVIWGLLQGVGRDVVAWIGDQLLGGGASE